jgi:hypothetical protein
MTQAPRIPFMSRDRRLTAAFMVLVCAFAWFFYSWIIGYVDGPIVFKGDTAQYGFTSFYLVHNISWFPLPQLALSSDWTHYPYGANHVFLHWAFERDLVVGALNGLCGPGPWFQLYLVVSMAGTAIGAFLLLRTVHEVAEAALAGFVIGFCNFYAICKFPAHMPHSVVHWTALGIVLDYVLVRHFVNKEAVPPYLVIGRVALVALSLGLELGYIAGFGLLSFTITAVWVAVLAAIRGGFRELLHAPASRWKRWLAAARARPVLTTSALVLVLLGSWLYLPLSAQVALTSATVDSHEVEYRRWENPLRIFLPFLPGINPEIVGEKVLGDHGEGWGFHFSPGLAFTLLAIFGITVGARRWPVYLPILVTFLMCLFFHPAKLPTLHLFPWFTYARVPGRATAVFPVLLVLLALSAWPLSRKRRWHKVAVVVLMLLLVTETTVAYGIMSSDRMSPSSKQLVVPDEDFWQLMQVIRDAPGEAVLDWPFAISAGGRLNVYRKRLRGMYHLAQFHQKKVLGAHLGRPWPGNLTAFQEAGWPHMFLPDAPRDLHQRLGIFSYRQRRDFVDEEWQFISSFLELNDFCGILLYPDLLPVETVQGFYERFGEPVARASFPPGPGRMEFIPKPQTMKAGLDREAGRTLRLQRPVLQLPLGVKLRADKFAIEDFLLDGWNDPQAKARRTVDRQARIRFSVEHPVPIMFTLLASGVARQQQRVLFDLNGTEIASFKVAKEENQRLEVLLPVEAMREENTLTLSFPDARIMQKRNGSTILGLLVRWIKAEEVEDPALPQQRQP